jgi:hypothetical protein
LEAFTWSDSRKQWVPLPTPLAVALQAKEEAIEKIRAEESKQFRVLRELALSTSSKERAVGLARLKEIDSKIEALRSSF